MKRDEIKAILGDSATDDVIKKIMEINGGDIEHAKGEFSAVKAQLDEATATIDRLQSEVSGLKDSNASASEWKTKFEALTADIEAERKKAADERAVAERHAAVKKRFDAACVGNDGKPLHWAHDAISRDYLARFEVAIEAAENAGKSDVDIFHELTKDDAGAFSTVQREVLKGGSVANGGSQSRLAQIYKNNPFYKGE